MKLFDATNIFNDNFKTEYVGEVEPSMAFNLEGFTNKSRDKTLVFYKYGDRQPEMDVVTNGAIYHSSEYPKETLSFFAHLAVFVFTLPVGVPITEHPFTSVLKTITRLK